MLHIGKIIIIFGILLIIVGFILVLSDRLGIHLGKLPGDIIYRKGNTTFYFPIVTSILLSLFLTFLFWIFKK